MIARVADGRLTTVARTVIATSSSEAAPPATELRSWKTYVPTRYSVTVGRRSPLRHIAGVPPADEVEGDQQVGEPRVRHHLGLAELLAGQPGRAGVELPARDLDGLVGLDVRPVDESDPVGLRLPARDVRLEPVEIDDRDRRIE